MSTPKPVKLKKPPIPGGPDDRVRVSLTFRISPPDTYSSFEFTTDYETSMLEQDGGNVRALHVRARRTVEELHGQNAVRFMRELGLDEHGKPLKRGTVDWQYNKNKEG